MRVPRHRAAGYAELEILADTRERCPWRFDHQQARTQQRALPAEDYAVELDGEVVAVVERKTWPTWPAAWSTAASPARWPSWPACPGPRWW